MSFVAVAAAGIGAAATIGTGIMKNNTQRAFNEAKIKSLQEDSATKRLTATEKNALAAKVANAATDTERIKILSDTLSRLGGATTDANAAILSAGVTAKAQQNYITNSIVMATGILLVGGTVGLMLKKD